LKKDENTDVLINRLYKLTPLQTNFNFNMVGLINNVPQLLNLKTILCCFIEHRREVITRRTMFELDKAERRMHIVDGLIKALEHIDEIIALIKASPSPEIAKEGLCSSFGFSEVQAQAILDMRLQRLTGLERDKLTAEHAELQATIEKLRAILADTKLVDDMIVDDLEEVNQKFGDERMTEVIKAESSTLNLDEEDLIKDEPMVITVTRDDYIKRQELEIYQTQNRGGKGITGGKMKEEDAVRDIFVTNTKDILLFFSNIGKLRGMKVYQLEEASRTARGKSVVNYLDFGKDEKISTLIPVKNFTDPYFLLMVTRKGRVKKTPLAAFVNLRKKGVTAINLPGDDQLISVNLTTGDNEVIIVTKNGQSIRFAEKNVRAMGRLAAGVRAIRLKGGDEVVNADIVRNPASTLLVATEKGYGKRTPIDEYRIQSRGGSGIKTIKISEKTGKVISIIEVDADDELLLITRQGMIVRCKTRDISQIGRTTQGVRLIRLKPEDTLVAVEKIRTEFE
ncbi:MAG: DNA gyrase C-terminal beta-propeller domain-containing protein, partial [Candidatus Wallbacteria bacterium]|nr:DNA gyrase C-terminal beta-propeller domain-containing protein [Candidatus Wallbacteria bacterium]